MNTKTCDDQLNWFRWQTDPVDNWLSTDGILRDDI